MARNLRGGLKIPDGTLGAYQKRSPTCHADEGADTGWRYGVEGWQSGVWDFYAVHVRQPRVGRSRQPRVGRS